MQASNTSSRKTNRNKSIGSFMLLGLVALGPILFYVWFMNLDRSGTYHNVTDVADLNSDGDLDVVLHNVRTESEFTAFSVLTLWFNQGDGKFTSQRLGDAEFGSGMGSGWASATGDVDLDGNVDLAVFSGWQLGVLYNQGEQHEDFGRARMNKLGGDGQFGSIALGDLNHDGRVDGVIAGCCGRQFTIDPERSLPNLSWIWINEIEGNKSAPIPALEGLAIRDIALGDLDGDVDLDLFAAVMLPDQDQNTDPSDRVLYNGGLGNLSDSGQRLGETDSTAVALGDLDGDGDLDALVGTEMEALVWINQGRAQDGLEGEFELAEQTLFGREIKDVFLSDFDMDGDQDALIAGIREANIWWNDGQATFTKSSQRFRYTKRHGLAVGDFNGDSYPDMFIAEYYKMYTLWLNEGDGSFQAVR